MSLDSVYSCSSSNQDIAGHEAIEPPKLLEGIGSAVVSLTFYVLRKSRDLPCLVGPVIGAVEDILSPSIQPLATRVGTEGMYLLSLADEKLFAVGEIAMEKVPLVSSLVSNAKGVHSFIGQVTTVASSAYEQVSERGMIGAAADTWVKYEVTVKSKSAESLKFVKRIPLLNVFVPVMYTVGTPIASAISSWLSKHSEFQDKHLVLHEVHLLDDEVDLKGVTGKKHLFVVDNGAEIGSNMDIHNNSSEIDFADSATPENSESSTHSEIVRKSDLYEEVEEVKEEKLVRNETSGEEKSDVTVVTPVCSADEDSDDELTVLFNAGWSLGKVSPQRQILVEPKASKKGWWAS